MIKKLTIALIAALILLGITIAIMHKGDTGRVVTGLFKSEAMSYDVTASSIVKPKVNCLDGESMRTEVCVKRITDDFAETFVAMSAQEKVVEEALEKLNQLEEEYNQSAFNMETLVN